MSEWLKLHYAVFDHPKTKRMAKILKTPPAAVVGHLASLWAFTAKYASDGNLTEFEDEEIEIGAGWEGKDGAFIKAALTVSFLDSDGNSVSIHDWQEYGGEWANRRARNAARMRAVRHGDVPPVQRTCDAPELHSENCANHSAMHSENCAGLEEIEKKDQKTSAAKIAAKKNEDWEKRANEVLEKTSFAPLYRDLADILAAANKTGEVRTSRVVRSLYEPLWEYESNGTTPAAFEYGLRAAIGKGAANVNYVKQAAKSYVGTGGSAGAQQDIGPPPRDPDPGYCWTKVTNPFTEELEWAQKRGERE